MLIIRRQGVAPLGGIRIRIRIRLTSTKWIIPSQGLVVIAESGIVILKVSLATLPDPIQAGAEFIGVVIHRLWQDHALRTDVIVPENSPHGFDAILQIAPE